MASVQDALDALCKSIPSWNARLDDLNGQIAERQIELARLMDDRPPTARSMRNKGSTESLRPKDCNNEEPSESKQALSNGTTSATAKQRPSSAEAARARAAAVTPPPPPKANSNPRPSPHALVRQSSQPTPPGQNRTTTGLPRKRKTESLASGESLIPKYRTRSMIIVYYDSAVQTAFEELVKFVSGSRNAMRKGKMAAKMAEMRKAAELEVEGEEDADGNHSGPPSFPSLYGSQKKAGAFETENAFTLGAPMPKLRFTSTRQMAQPKNGNKPEEVGSTLNLGLLRGYRRNDDGAPSIFDELDKGLEWCQSRCEHAAHQFLREGECSAEIESIKKRLLEVKAGGEREVERLRAIAAIPKVSKREAPDHVLPRQAKSIQVRRSFGAGNLEVDHEEMEVDEDEGVDDMEPPKLVFKRSRDIGY